ncbi:hypothetical protein [Hydrogenophaga atypica]|uniref:Ada DNA repair metal-binding domain-containing protein n=1 Tax=Hydrogenophaga atypica TaxID=249409 RepID=A0ABW2QPT5_9BURK
MLKNRVDPWGALNAVPDRGTLMGNRGILHNENNEVIRPWTHKGWVTCLLSYKSIRRPKPFSAGNYSELFFLDEATAFAAGHRPCTTCQRERSKQFKEAWIRANVGTAGAGQHIAMSEIDKVLHNERAQRGGGKRSYAATLSELPLGTMFSIDSAAYLVGRSGYHRWSFSGYGEPEKLADDATVSVLTPASIVSAFSAGFVPAALVTSGQHSHT